VESEEKERPELLFLSLACNVPAGADDFLPVLIYVVIHANPPQLASNLEYIQRFRMESRMVSESAYFYTQLVGAHVLTHTHAHTHTHTQRTRFGWWGLREKGNGKGNCSTLPLQNIEGNQVRLLLLTRNGLGLTISMVKTAVSLLPLLIRYCCDCNPVTDVASVICLEMS
jgi:hypothetical protein